MNENRFFFKKFVPIYKAQDKICIGIVGTDDYLETDFNEYNYKLLEKLLKHGIEESSIRIPLYDRLNKRNFLELSSTVVNDSKSSRSELFLEYILNKPTSDEIRIVKIKPILIFGAGAGGSTLIYLLAQFGFKNIFVIDFDIVSESDLGKIMIFDKPDIGSKKISSLKEKIKINFSIDINIIDANLSQEIEIERVINLIKPEIVVKACDPDGIFLMNLNKVCFKHKIPYISMAYSYDSLKIGPLLVPNITSCSEAISKDVMKHYGDHYKIDQFKRLFNDYLVHPSISFNINTLSSLIFKEILFFLIEEYDFCQTIGRIITFNPLSFSTNSYLVKCDEYCKICSYNGKTI